MSEVGTNTCYVYWKRGADSVFSSASGSFIPPASVNKVKQKSGPYKMFLPGGVLSVELTDKIKHQLKDRKYLEDNEIDLINCLLSTYIRSDINNKNC